MPTESYSVITSYEVQGENKVVRANRDIARTNQAVTRTTNDVTDATIGSARAYADVTRASADASKEAADLSAEQLKQERALRRAAKAADDAAGGNAKAAAAMALMNVAMFAGVQLLKDVARAFKEAAVEMFENTEEGERLAEAWDTLKGTVILSLLPFEKTRALLGKIADALDNLSGKIIDVSVEYDGNVAAGQAVLDQMDSLDSETQDLIAQWAVYGRHLGMTDAAMVGQAARAGELGTEIQKLVSSVADLAEEERRLDFEAGLSQEDVEDVKDYERAIQSLASTMRRAAAAQAQFNRQRQEIVSTAASERIQAATDRFTGLMEVEFDLRAEVATINRNANRATERATTQHQRNITRITEQGARDRARAIAQHQMQEDFQKRRFDLSAIQSERLYLASRARLAAEGDVIAIDELDERYELQKEIEEENFRLQQQRQEATFQMQLRFQEQAARQQAQILSETLAEQLRAIEDSRQERVTEAELGAQEERMAIKGGYALELAAIDQQEQEKLRKLEEAWHERQLKDAEAIALFIQQNELGAAGVLAAWSARFGTGGEFDRVVLGALRRMRQEVAAITAALAGVSVSGGTSGSTGRRPCPPGVPDIFCRQHGGDDIVTRPTMFMVGEAGPERVIVQPLSLGGGGVRTIRQPVSSMGGVMAVRWQGGPIPLEGRGGGLENLDLAPVGQALAQGLTTSIMEAFLRQRGNWGR